MSRATTNLEIRSAREDDVPGVARVIAQAYRASHYRPEVTEREIRDHYMNRVRPDEVLVAVREGAIAGTATGLSLQTWVGGRRLPLFGIAGVAVGWEHRRQGIASELMKGLLRRAVQDTLPLAALYPFRASFYATHGFGTVETDAHYDCPLHSLPKTTAGARELTEEDFPRVKQAYQDHLARGCFGVERSDLQWEGRWSGWSERMRIGVQRDGFGYMIVRAEGGTLRVEEIVWPDPSSLRDLLGFPRSLSDQFQRVHLRLPSDLPLFTALEETDFKHEGPGRWSTTSAGMAKVTDISAALTGRRHLDGLNARARFRVTDSLDGTESDWDWEIEDGAGRAERAGSSREPDLVFTSGSFAQWVLGSVSATGLSNVGALRMNDDRLLPRLDAAMAGPAPFNMERF